MSWGCGNPLPIDVSGVPLLRGGGGAWGSREYGWYVLVCIFLFVDMRADCASEIRRSAWRHGRSAGVAEEAKAHWNSLEVDEASGVANLGVAILCD